MRHYFYKHLLLPAMLLFCSIAFAQEFTTVSGRVEDATTGAPLQYASIVLKGSTMSTVTNADGRFTFKVPNNNLNDTLMVSFLGYRNLDAAVAEFNPKRLKRLKLYPTSLDIRSITIRGGDAAQLFKSAFSSRSIKANYMTQPRGMSGFYREMIKKGNRYLSLSEAVVDIMKQSYSNSLGDNIAIYKGRGNTNKNASDTLFLQLQGGPVTTIQLDVVKDPFIATDMISATDFYEFRMGPMVYMDDLNIYTIDFNQVPKLDDILFRGRIFVESQTLAIVRIEFQMNVENDNDSWKRFVRKKPDGMQLGVEWAKYQINYKQHGDKWFMDYARIDLRFNAKYKGKWLKNKYDIITELAITDIDNPNVLKIPLDQRLRMKDIMQKKVADFQDENFWEGYNIIEPDEKIENIINRIVRQLKKERD